MRTTPYHDVVVVGARAAGAATALHLARLGHDVVVVDRADLPSDTISTHQLARTAVVALHRWGLLHTVVASGAPAITQVRFDTNDEVITRTIKRKFGVDCLLAPRRYVLDTLLAEAAQTAGAYVHSGVSIAGLLKDDDGRVTGVHGLDRHGEAVQIRARFVVGADGLGSRIARAVDSPKVVDRGAPGASHYAYFAGIDWPAVEYITREGSFAGVFPTHHDEAAIWVCTPAVTAVAARRTGSPVAAFWSLLRRAAPELATRLSGARRTSPVRGMLRAPNHIRLAHGNGWALVGDAGAHRDPVTGHGISDAFRDAEALAAMLDLALTDQAPESVALANYERTRRREMAEIFDLTCALVGYPPVPEFVDLNRQFGAAVDAEAAALAARPLPTTALAAA